MQSLDSLKQNEEIAEWLKNWRTVAVVGLSPKESRPSNMVGRYLLDNGFTIYPVNPGQKEIFGLKCYSDLEALDEPVDIVDVFRRSEDVLAVVEQVVKMSPLPKVVWMQQGIVNEEAATLARKKGIHVVMDRCIKVDHQNLVRS